MVAEAGKAEGNEDEAPQAKGQRKSRVKGHATKRRGALEVTRAISLTPFAGDITFNAKSGEKSSTSLYGTEVHATRYQYGFALTPEWLLEQPQHTLPVIDAIVGLSEVAGNQSRFLYDFSPDSVIFRWTDDFAPRLLYGFQLVGEQPQLREEVRSRIESNDIEAKELILGGSIASTDDAQFLKQRGAMICMGVKEAAAEVKARLRGDLKLKNT
jgi:CRISPR-associated protein Cst2